jgi:ParB-like chromosome segregation protein Spo0J
MNSVKTKISEIKLNPNNPRLIKDDKFTKLVQSIKDFPEMLDIRPIVVNSDMVILGGNMRFKACKEAGLKEVPIIVADNLTEEQQREFLIKDNTSGGEWDFEMLANEWDVEQLDAWGLDLPILNEKLVAIENEKPEIEITAEILEEHNYIVFTFDNQLDWQVAKEILNIKTVAKEGFTETYMQKGIGRVKSGNELIKLLQNGI